MNHRRPGPRWAHHLTVVAVAVIAAVIVVLSCGFLGVALAGPDDVQPGRGVTPMPGPSWVAP